MKAQGNLSLDYFIYDLLRVDLSTKSTAMLQTLDLPPKIFMPFLVLMIASLLTRRNEVNSLNRFLPQVKNSC